MLIIGFIIGVLISSGVVYAILKPKLRQTQQLDLELIRKNEDAKKSLEEYVKKVDFNKNQLDTIQKELTVNINHNNQILEFMKEQQAHAETVGEEYLDACMQTAQIAADNFKSEMENAKDEYRKEYLELMSEMTESYRRNISDSETEYITLVDKLADLQGKVNAAVEAAKRAAEMESKVDFYRLNLSDIDIEEISKLRSIIQYLRDAEPLNKVIWKVYYEKPYTDLIGRVVGSSTKTGIYKITNLINQMCYVGQSTDIASRWKQHIKRGIGAEAPTRNKLYPAMLKFGVENFSFEIVEECSRSLLDEREGYWQEYFKAKEFGYSIK